MPGVCARPNNNLFRGGLTYSRQEMSLLVAQINPSTVRLRTSTPVPVPISIPRPVWSGMRSMGIFFFRFFQRSNSGCHLIRGFIPPLCFPQCGAPGKTYAPACVPCANANEPHLIPHENYGRAWGGKKQLIYVYQKKQATELKIKQRRAVCGLLNRLFADRSFAIFVYGFRWVRQATASGMWLFFFVFLKLASCRNGSLGVLNLCFVPGVGRNRSIVTMNNVRQMDL